MSNALARMIAWGTAAVAGTNVSLAQDACEAAHLSASDGGAHQSFGEAVAACGDTALIGAGGKVYVFRFDGTTWSETQQLTVKEGGGFGAQVALDGQRALIAGGSGGVGAGFVFVFDGSRWIEQQVLVGSDTKLDDYFGWSLAISGDIALIAAPADDDNIANSGSVYVFRFDGSSWNEQPKLHASDFGPADSFGSSVAVDGDVAVIGASGQDDAVGCAGIPQPALCDSGAAYVFRFDGSDWVEEQKLLASDGVYNDSFGWSVSISGDGILVGTQVHPDISGPGKAYVFRFNPRGEPGSQWVQEQILLPGAPGTLDFGRAVALSGDAALVGAWRSDNHMGSAFLFHRAEGVWSEPQQLLPDPGPWTAFFGWSVALCGDTAVVGAHGENAQSGGAYVYAGASGSDCNGNGVADGCELLKDADGNGIPDECEQCPWDLDGSGEVGVDDFLALLGAWGPNPGHTADIDGDGVVAIGDFLELLAHWGPCP